MTNWSKEKIIICILIAGLWLTNMYMIVLYKNAETKVNQLEEQYQQLQDYTQNMIDNYTNNFASQLNNAIEKQKEILIHDSNSIGTINTEKQTAMLNFEVTPKEYNDTTVVSLEINQQKITFEKNGSIFKGSVEVPLFEELEGPLVVNVDTNGLVSTQRIYLHYSRLYEQFMPQFEHYSGGSTNGNYKDGKYHINFGNRLIQLRNYGDVKFVKTELIVKINDKEVNRINYEPIIEDESFCLNKNLKVKAEEYDDVDVYIYAVDELGIEHYKQVYFGKDLEMYDNTYYYVLPNGEKWATPY